MTEAVTTDDTTAAKEVATEATTVCPACGYRHAGEVCTTCDGSIQELSSQARIKPGRGFFLFDMIEGALAPFLAMLTLMTRREYMGKLKWVVLANFVAVIALGIVAWYGIFAFFDTEFIVRRHRRKPSR